MSRSVLKELEDLRILLRSPRPSLSAGKVQPAESQTAALPKQYTDVLKDAEVLGFLCKSR